VNCNVRHVTFAPRSAAFAKGTSWAKALQSTGMRQSSGAFVIQGGSTIAAMMCESCCSLLLFPPSGGNLSAVVCVIARSRLLQSR
jgi:hypothetical protein